MPLDPWVRAELPVPPAPSGFGWLRVVGPGVIVLGVSIGGGEFLLGPAAFVRHGLSLLWVVPIAVVLQTIFNTEVMRYTLATGEPVFTGFMRTRPSSTVWACVYTGLYFLQIGWPGAGRHGGRRRSSSCSRGDFPAPRTPTPIYFIGVAAFLVVRGHPLGRQADRADARAAELGAGRGHPGRLPVRWPLAFVPGAHLAGRRAPDSAASTWNCGRFDFFPAGADSRPAGRARRVLRVRRRGQPHAVELGEGQGLRHGGARRLHSRRHRRSQGEPRPHRLHLRRPMPRRCSRWRGWWRLVRVDQWGVFCVRRHSRHAAPGAPLRDVPAARKQHPGPGDQRGARVRDRRAAGAMLGGAIAFLGAWLLFKTQLDLLDGMVRALTDILWTGSRRVRAWRGGDVRSVYYCVMAVVVLWAIIALRLAQPIVLLLIAANVARRRLRRSRRCTCSTSIRGCCRTTYARPLWRRAALVAMALFYGFFVTLSVGTLWNS